MRQVTIGRRSSIASQETVAPSRRTTFPNGSYAAPYVVRQALYCGAAQPVNEIRRVGSLIQIKPTTAPYPIKQVSLFRVYRSSPSQAYHCQGRLPVGVTGSASLQSGALAFCSRAVHQ